MAGNYPAGVTGSEWQITGEYDENAEHPWDCEVCSECGACSHTEGPGVHVGDCARVLGADVKEARRLARLVK